MIVLHPHEIEELVDGVVPALDLTHEQKLSLFAVLDRAAALVEHRVMMINAAQTVHIYRENDYPPEAIQSVEKYLLKLSKESPNGQVDCECCRGRMQMVDDVLRSITGGGYGGA